MFYTYILYSEKIEKLYFGFTENVGARLKRHNSESQQSTVAGVPWKLLYFSEHENASLAKKEEKCWKNLKSRKKVFERIEKTMKKYDVSYINEALFNELRLKLNGFESRAEKS